MKRRPPRPPREGVFTRGMIWQVIWAGLLMAGITLPTQAYGVYSGNKR